MLLTRLLNACHHFLGFVYAGARLCAAEKLSCKLFVEYLTKAKT